ncbi:hypothetical protein QSV34_03915 [Porticoccus sp. W117]|uniref:hypothetical protein n=1 Tax=Porticoccus sp. W117 TaxID=3054777 RepID=UPI002595F539|nr:hypothetical protein [Porticoccus sp. W117]MDM3870499.1 hypothetical protein [Porticoccus sp. W117]
MKILNSTPSIVPGLLPLLRAIAVGCLCALFVGCADNSNREKNYAEARVKIKQGSHNIEMVAIVERYKDLECKPDEIYLKLIEMCDGLENCTTLKYECKDQLNKRYTKMFAKQPTTSKYLHMTHNKTELNGVAIFWGLTADESAQVCQMTKQQILNKGGREIDAVCI